VSESRAGASESTIRFRDNNLDLLRLVAAMQVAVVHSKESFGVELPSVVEFLLDAFPGVPVFFFLSGLLIYRSYGNAGGLAQFALNRGLRLLPALWTCVLLSLLSVWATGYALEGAGIWKILIWLTGQMTFVQFYNPSWLRDYGVGVVNGSLWTIAVEIQFYALTPLLWRSVQSARGGARTLLVLAAVFALGNLAYISLPRDVSDGLAGRLMMVSFVPWFYMFVLGAAVAMRPELIEASLSRPLWQWLSVYVLLAGATRALGLPLGNLVNPALVAALIPVVLHAGFARPGLAARWLHGSDISYGAYIYHMPVINVVLATGALVAWPAVFATLACTVILAALSWRVVERPALRLKRRTLRPV
jgi:peptidoglycan/LPS O-acetylase OafA/YrhL